jgi:hypothetical protein
MKSCQGRDSAYVTKLNYKLDSFSKKSYTLVELLVANVSALHAVCILLGKLSSQRIQP